MARFHERLLEVNAPLLERSRNHPFVLKMADGTLPRGAFLRWLSQDYLWVRELEQFLSLLASRAPRQMRRTFFEALLTQHGEIELFEEAALRAQADIKGTRMGFTCHAYSSFLLATVSARSFEEALAGLYAAEFTYVDAWSHVKSLQEKPGPWQEFVDLWSGDGYRHWVGTLAGIVDQAAEASSSAVQQAMHDAFRIALHYELRFWNAAFEEEKW